MALHSYTVKFTAGKASKQMGAKSELNLEDFKALVQRQLDNKANLDEKRKALPVNERSKVKPAAFFGYDGKIDRLEITESDVEKNPPANSPIKKIAAVANP